MVVSRVLAPGGSGAERGPTGSRGPSGGSEDDVYSLSAVLNGPIAVGGAAQLTDLQGRRPLTERHNRRGYLDIDGANATSTDSAARASQIRLRSPSVIDC